MRLALSAFLMFFLSNLVFGSVRVATYNINYSRSADREWKWSNRKNRVFAQIAKIDADVLCLQEVVKSHDLDDRDDELSFDDIHKILGDLGYVTFSSPYRTPKQGFELYLVTAVKKDLLHRASVEYRGYHFNDLFDDLEHLKLGSFQAVYLNFKNGKKVLIHNHHFPLDRTKRMVTSSLLYSLNEKMGKVFYLEKDHEILRIHLGDFNSLPDVGGASQVELLVALNDLYNFDKSASLSSKENPIHGKKSLKTKFTFVGFPHDVDRAAANGVSFTKSRGFLDHIFLSDIDPYIVGSLTVWNEFPIEVDYNYKHWQGGGEKRTVIYPSDHLPMSCDLDL